MFDYFRLFNEIGIIEQLSRTLLEARLPPGFVLAQFSVLNHLVRVGDGRTPVAMAQAFQVPKTSMTHSLAVLERGGLIEIRKNPKDGRSKLVYITDAGQKFRQDAINSLAPDLARIASAFPPEHVARILPDLEALRKFLDTDRDASI
ncbi:MAG: MarR family winged helix-turn-helix transcriptional regulator [Hoeflea sp.]|uniref:MarR family winged helix-turn-helix transcriptional regulator n=1 Tax=Hoeflea sp. TaxID=1940281 RepID=UPI002731E17A|nr:MarR family winged helix-turn-helix transcriptional regulator [Hoeflea sp.]MDP2121262.1 MarR family winged helix-turn-helix transcriptional regulator [Hoeflea sp.]MDP3524298.1 MarR family winged helix-turn-helix transcriptional regulator [Hoeflea sp.]MDZ7599952.1 MarR family winged helix-turn-helix transcriptional regulator [Hoeflea sp.]